LTAAKTGSRSVRGLDQDRIGLKRMALRSRYVNHGLIL
jgi:hypothetical protein